MDIYRDPVEVRLQQPPISKGQPESSRVTDQVQVLDTRTAQQLLNITTKTLRRLQKQVRFCRKKVNELKTGTHDEFYLNSKNILKRKTIVNNLEVNAIVIQTPLTYTLLHEFHNCKGHQGSTRTFNMLKCNFWWKGMRLDIYTTCHPQLHLEIPKLPFACITIDTIGKLPTTSSGNRYTLICIDLLTSYIIAVPIPNKAAESVVEAYFSEILSRNDLESPFFLIHNRDLPEGHTGLLGKNDIRY